MPFAVNGRFSSLTGIISHSLLLYLIRFLYFLFYWLLTEALRGGDLSGRVRVI